MWKQPLLKERGKKKIKIPTAWRARGVERLEQDLRLWEERERRGKNRHSQVVRLSQRHQRVVPRCHKEQEQGFARVLPWAPGAVGTQVGSGHSEWGWGPSRAVGNIWQLHMEKKKNDCWGKLSGC